MKLDSAQLKAALQQFVSTTGYYRIDRKTLLTDGTYHLAETTGSYWLMMLFSSYLLELDLQDWFAVLKLEANDGSAKVIIGDGNDNVLATQEIGFNDFPLPEITVYACREGNDWVLMLPSEY